MTEEEIQAEIDEITLALSYIRKAGQSYTINSGSSTRTVSFADYNTLVEERRSSYAQLDEVQGNGGFTVSAGW